MDHVFASPLKINLTLRVTGILEGGYHSIASGVLRFPQGDVLHVREGKPSRQEDRVCTGNYVIEGENLLFRALRSLREQDPSLPFQDVHIEKNIPPGTGVGGGSGNVAAFLQWVYRRYALELDKEKRLALGADIPFLYSPFSCAFLTGKGERTEPLDVSMNSLFCLCFPSWGSETRGAYALLDRKKEEGVLGWTPEKDAREETLSLFRRLGKGKPVGLLPNDFLHTLSHQDRYEEFFALASAYFALGWGISGSGSSMYAIFPQGGGEENLHLFLKRVQSLGWIVKILYLELS